MTPDTIASAIIYLVGVSVVSHLISRRVLIDGAQCSLRQASWPRICVLIIFLDSYLFIFTAGVLILGVEMRTSSAACALGIYLCVVFYWSSKFFIYLFLVERVYVVWRPTPTASRWHSKVYMACMILLAPYFGVAALMFYGNLSQIKDGACFIGLRFIVLAPLMAYDLLVTLLLTTLFLWPLLRNRFRNNTIKRLAIRTLISSVIALVTSCVNVLISIIMRGPQPGWMCLAACSVDVVINALALFWMTDSASERTAVSPSSGGSHPVYELSSERISRQKGPGESSGDVSTDNRKSFTPRQPLVVVDRGLKMLFGREPTPQETRASTVDVEIAVHTETNIDVSLQETAAADSKDRKTKFLPWT